MEILAFMLSMASLLCMMLSSLIKGKNMKLILVLVGAANLFVALSYFVQRPMAVNGAITCTIGAVMSIINYFFDKDNKPVPKVLVAIYAVVIAGLNLSVAKSGVDMLTVLAGLVFVMSIIQKNGKMFRLYTIINLLLWCTYDVFKLSYGPLVQHTIQLLFIILGMLIHDRKKTEC